MTVSQRIAAMRNGELSLEQCAAWAARYPEQVPLLNGEFEYLAAFTPEVRRVGHAIGGAPTLGAPPDPLSRNTPAHAGGPAASGASSAACADSRPARAVRWDDERAETRVSISASGSTGDRVTSETTAICAGPDVLTIVTVLPDHGVVFQLTSTFVGHKGVDTHVTHLTLGPPGERPAIHAEDHPHERPEPHVRPKGMRLRAHPGPHGASEGAGGRAGRRSPRRRLPRP